MSVYVPRNFVHDETHFAHHIKCYYFQAKNSIDDSKYYSKCCKVPRLRLFHGNLTAVYHNPKWNVCDSVRTGDPQM